MWCQDGCESTENQDLFWYGLVPHTRGCLTRQCPEPDHVLASVAARGGGKPLHGVQKKAADKNVRRLEFFKTYQNRV